MIDYFKTLILVIWARILYDWFGTKRSKEPIPKDTPYCYDSETGIYCKYFKGLPMGYCACTFLGEINDDPTFDDGVKLCRINRPKFFEDNE